MIGFRKKDDWKTKFLTRTEPRTPPRASLGSKEILQESNFPTPDEPSGLVPGSSNRAVPGSIPGLPPPQKSDASLLESKYLPKTRKSGDFGHFGKKSPKCENLVRSLTA